MTLNDIAYWYYMGLAVQVLYVAIQIFRKRTGDDDIRLQKMWDFAAKEDIPMSVLYVILALVCLFWPYFLARKILRLTGIIKKKGS